MHRTLNPGLRLLALTLILVALFGPAAGASAQEPPSGELYVVMLAPLVKIYEGDTVTIPYIAEQKVPLGQIALAPLVPGKASVQAALGTASVQPGITGGTITYQAVEAGHETLTLSVENPLGAGSAVFEFVVYPKPNYNLDFYIVSKDDDQGAGYIALFSGSGEFSHSDETPVYGRGQADFWFSLYAVAEPVQCFLPPPVQGNTSFEIVPGDSIPLAPLVPDPSYVPPIYLTLRFQPMALNASTMACTGMGGFAANFPWPAQQLDSNDMDMRDLEVPGGGGIIPYTNVKTEGWIIVTRKGQ